METAILNHLPQRRSETLRKGNPQDHEIALEFVRTYLESSGYKTPTIQVNIPVKYDSEFIKEHKITKHPGHSLDLVALGLIVEMDGKRDYDYGYISGFRTKHDHTEQKINDGVVKSYCEKYFPKSRFVRLLKEEVNDVTRVQYLRKELG